MLVANLSGIGVGIILSFLTGPVFFALIKTSIEKGFFSGAALATGVLLADISWVTITFYGTRILEFEARYQKLTALFGGAFLIAVGVYYIAKKVELKYESIEDKFHFGHAGYLIKGFLITFFNPSVLVFWITVNSILKSVFHIDNEFDNYENILFFTSTLLTCYTMDITKAYFANKLRNKISGRTIITMNRIAGVVIICFGCRLILNLFIK